jgi:hypothetical protein
VTLLVNSRRPISNTIGVSFTGDMCSVSLAFKRHMQDRSSVHFCINQQSQSWPGLRRQQRVASDHDAGLPDAEEQHRIVHAIVRGVRMATAETHLHHRLCGPFALTTAYFLQQHRSPSYIFQAGWLRYGTGDPSTQEVAGVHPSCLPEDASQGEPYHAWVARQHRNGRVEMVDVTLGFWPRAARELGLAWQRPGFPSFLWTWADELGFAPNPWDVRYEPDPVVMKRLLSGWFGHGSKEELTEDLRHLLHNANLAYQHPDMVLFGMGGEVPSENPWGPMD